jgi:hypothetical protein
VVTIDVPLPYRPAGGVTLHGPFLTAREAEARVGRGLGACGRSLLCVSSAIGVGRAFPEFQFGDDGQTREVAFLAPLLTRRVSHEEACDWLLRPNPALTNLSPIAWLAADGDVQRVIDSLPHPSRSAPGIDVTEAEILEFKTRKQWVPRAYLSRSAA